MCVCVCVCARARMHAQNYVCMCMCVCTLLSPTICVRRVKGNWALGWLYVNVSACMSVTTMLLGVATCP